MTELIISTFLGPLLGWAWAAYQRKKKEAEQMDILAGKKTYITGAAMLVYAIAGVILGKMDYNAAVEMAGVGLGFIFVRSAVK